MAVGEAAHPGPRDACSQWRNHLLDWAHLYLHSGARASRGSDKAGTWSLLIRGHALTAARRSLLKPSSSLSRFSFSVHITQVPRRGKPQSEVSRRMTSSGRIRPHYSIVQYLTIKVQFSYCYETMNYWIRIVKSFCYYLNHLKIGTKTSVVLNFSFIAFSIFTKILNI